jgi:hypothetical protein
LHANRVEKMLVVTQSSTCAFFLALGAHWPVIRHAELCGAALTQNRENIYLYHRSKKAKSQAKTAQIRRRIFALINNNFSTKCV